MLAVEIYGSNSSNLLICRILGKPYVTMVNIPIQRERSENRVSARHRKETSFINSTNGGEG